MVYNRYRLEDNRIKFFFKLVKLKKKVEGAYFYCAIKKHARINTYFQIYKILYIYGVKDCIYRFFLIAYTLFNQSNK